ncbi:hypothetical protein GCM10027601_43300 [Nocardioides ungokensis]
MRDWNSYDRAIKWFPNAHVEFCPDMAYGAGRQERPLTAEYDVTAVLRKDSEAVSGSRSNAISSLTSLESGDWGLSGAEQLRWLLYRMPENCARVAPPMRRYLAPMIDRAFNAMIRTNVASARRIIAQGRTLLTDRLHATVLGQLMGIPVVALDNANGKIRAAYSAYIQEVGGVTMVDSMDEALSLLRDGGPIH